MTLLRRFALVAVRGRARAGARRRRHLAALGRRPVLGHPGHVAVGAGQRRHRHRRPGQPVQRLRLPEAAGAARAEAARPPCAISTCAASAWPTTAASASTASRRCCTTAWSSRGRSSRRGTPTGCATSTACSTAPTSRARCRWRGAAPPAPTTTAAAPPWPPPRAATRGSTPPTRFVTMMQNARRRRRSAAGAVGPRPVGPRARLAAGAAHRDRRHVRRSVRRRLSRLRPRRTSATSSRSTSRRGPTVALVTFVVKGLSEVYDPRGGYPIARQDALLFTWSDPVYAGADKRVPAAGQRDRARHRAGARRWPRRPTCAVSRRAAAVADRQLGLCARRRRRGVHGVRAVGRAAAGGDDRGAWRPARTSSATT